MDWIKRKILWRKRFYILLTFIGFVWFFYQYTSFRLNDNTMIERLSANSWGYDAEVCYYQYQDRPMRYLEIGDNSKPLIVFIHGAPSSSSFWENMLRDSILLHNAKLLAIDRPGYGFSGYGVPEVSVRKQAAAIAAVLKEKRAQHSNIILHGSSYGGTVAARLAMDFPNLVDGLLLQSASLAPEREKTYWISYPTSHWALKWLVPGALKVANAEKLSHRDQLKAMAALWENIRSAVIIGHGTADGLIYPDNAQYAKSRLVNASFLETRIFAGLGHNLLWTQPKFLKNALLKLIEITDTQHLGENK